MKVAGRRRSQQRLVGGKMTGTVRGAETDSSFVLRWVGFVS